MSQCADPPSKKIIAAELARVLYSYPDTVDNMSPEEI